MQAREVDDDMTTRETIGSWFDSGKAQGFSHMVVICDTFDHDDYPAYCTADTVRMRAEKPGKMQRAMEVYDLSASKDGQLAERRAWHLPESKAIGAVKVVSATKATDGETIDDLAKRWTDEDELTPEDSKRLAEWAVNLAVSRGSWMSVKTDLVDEHGLTEQDAEDLAFQLRILVHHLAVSNREAGPS